jgi:PII-like signaling protein
MLRVFLAGDSKCDGRPVYEAVVDKCREMHVAGATVLRGNEGFGSSPEIQTKPVEVTIVDEAAKIEALIPSLERLLITGAMVVSDVRMKRVSGRE